MSGTEGKSASKLEERQTVLKSLQALLDTIGSANDAEDHGYCEDARQMRKDLCEAIRSLMAKNAFLAEIFPQLEWELDTGHILGFGWAELSENAEKYGTGQARGENPPP